MQPLNLNIFMKQYVTRNIDSTLKMKKTLIQSLGWVHKIKLKEGVT